MTTLEEHLTSAECDEKLKNLILLLSQQAKPIKNAFVDKQNYAGTKNMHGDDQVELDKWADELLIDVLRESGTVQTIASEEQSDII